MLRYEDFTLFETHELNIGIGVLAECLDGRGMRWWPPGVYESCKLYGTEFCSKYRDKRVQLSVSASSRWRFRRGHLSVDPLFSTTQSPGFIND
jgi:hypothetical protein